MCKIKELTNCAFKILNAKYETAHLPQIVKDPCSHLIESEKLELLSLIQKYESIFDGTLGE